MKAFHGRPVTRSSHAILYIYKENPPPLVDLKGEPPLPCRFTRRTSPPHEKAFIPDDPRGAALHDAGAVVEIASLPSEGQRREAWVGERSCLNLGSRSLSEPRNCFTHLKRARARKLCSAARILIWLGFCLVFHRFLLSCVRLRFWFSLWRTPRT